MSRNGKQMTGANVQERWLALKADVERICRGSSRNPESVTVVGVSKYVGVDQTLDLISAGCMDLGESRPQQLWQKAEALQAHAPRWHMIGHLQRNKVARTLPMIFALHSLDSLRLAEAVSQNAVQLNVLVRCFVEVNISEEAAKTGHSIAELPSFLEKLIAMPGIRIVGLMGMASDTLEEAVVRRQFTTLRDLRDELRERYADDVHSIDGLSMGMSQDYPMAIECGATHLRIGSTLFR